VKKPRWPMSTGASLSVERPSRTATRWELLGEYDALKRQLEHCRETIDRLLQHLPDAGGSVAPEVDIFSHGPQGAD
jgi:hypothetical protein